MADFNFDIPERFDANTADDGVWFEVYDENKTHWGDFKCAHVDPLGKTARLYQQRIRTKYAKEIRTDTLDTEKVAIEFFLENVLKDWRSVKDAKGKEVPYSKEAARAYFSMPQTKFAHNALVAFSDDVRNYQKVTAEEVSGN